ncbi:MAG: substrate-binding domain-containing protein [Bacteroidales bacterium]|nr:substrate-binding domain-containing protein [Bacteroidales bacterium]
MKNRIVYLSLLLLLGILILGACTQKANIGFLMDDSKTGRWAEDKAQFTKQIEEKDGVVYFKASEGDAEKQYQLAEELLNLDIDVLVIIPTDRYQAAKIVQLAHEKHVKVIAYDRIIQQCNLDFYISFDSEKVGQLQAEYMTGKCPAGNYVILKGPVTDNNTYLLCEGHRMVLDTLIKKGDIRVVYENYVNYWSAEEGYRLMKECLEQNQQIDAVLASNDQLAEGAIRALKEKGITDFPFICGQDADPAAIERIKNGEQTMTVDKPISSIATKAAEIAVKLANDEAIDNTISTNNEYKQVNTILLSPAIIDQ